MRHISRAVLASAALLCWAASANAQSASAGATDVYHVHFAKAVPGQGVALADILKKPDSTTPMPEHFVVLRHQQGDDRISPQEARGLVGGPLHPKVF